MWNLCEIIMIYYSAKVWMWAWMVACLCAWPYDDLAPQSGCTPPLAQDSWDTVQHTGNKQWGWMDGPIGLLEKSELSLSSNSHVELSVFVLTGPSYFTREIVSWMAVTIKKQVLRFRMGFLTRQKRQLSCCCTKTRGLVKSRVPPGAR